MNELVEAVGFPNPNPAFWKGRRVLLTGHTGFKGGWLAIWLNRLGAKICGLSLPPTTVPSLFEEAAVVGLVEHNVLDIRDFSATLAVVKHFDPEVVFHLAAQPLVREGYRDPIGTFSTNVQGTVNILEAIRYCKSAMSIVVVTTDKVYENTNLRYPFRETDALGGHDPYSASKAAAELVVTSYRRSFFKDLPVAVASARAGNVIGGGDWSVDRLIPDAVRAWSARHPLAVRNPDSVRPWQHVLEPLSGYIRLAEKLSTGESLEASFNFGPNPHEAATVRAVVNEASSFFDYSDVIWEGDGESHYEARWLSLEIARSRHMLDFQPRWDLRQTIAKTMGWYRQRIEGHAAISLCNADITAFTG